MGLSAGTPRTNPIPQRSAFGEARVVTPHPVAQVDAVYGLTEQVSTDVGSSGTATHDGAGLFTASTGVDANSWAQLQTKRTARYRPGQGASARFTAFFDTPVASSRQLAGAGNPQSGVYVGYDGLDFGILHRTGGYHEIQRLTLTVGSGGAETLTLTLDGVAYAPTVIAGSAASVARQVEVWVTANVSTWGASSNGDTVTFARKACVVCAGAFTLSSTGTTAGTFARRRAGVVPTETWVLEADWNGGSGLTLDPTLGNVYAIDVQYLGQGAVFVWAEDKTTGRLALLHCFEFSGTLATPTLTNPSFRVGIDAISDGSTTDLTVKSACFESFVDGAQVPLNLPRGQDVSASSVGTTLIALLSIRNRLEYGGSLNLREVFPRRVTATGDGTKAVIVELLLNPTFDPAATQPVWTYQDETYSAVEYDTTGKALVAESGRNVGSMVFFGGTGESLSFGPPHEAYDLPLYLAPGDVLTIAAKVRTATATVDASIVWVED